MQKCARPAGQHPRVFDAGGPLELPRRESLGHGSRGNVLLGNEFMRRTRARRGHLVLTREGQPGPARASESYPNESGKRCVPDRGRVTEEIERILVHDRLPGDERHGRTVPSHRSFREHCKL